MRALRGIVVGAIAVLLAGACTDGPDGPVDEAAGGRGTSPLALAPRLTVDVPGSSGDEGPAGWTADLDGSVVTLHLDEREPGGGTYWFGADGTVRRATDRTVFMDRADLTSWTLPQAELHASLRRLDALGVRGGAPRHVEPGRGPTVGIEVWDRGVERHRETNAPDVLAVVRDMTAPPDRGLRRWAPDTIGFLAGPPDLSPRSPLGPRDPYAPWPLRRGVHALATGRLPNAYDEPKLALCLRGAQAHRVWRRLFTGVNTAYLRVDDGRRWELQSFVSLPGYQELSSPCGGGAP